MKAKEWLERGVESGEPVDRFSNLWRGFNNLFDSENGRTERNKIKIFLSANISEDSALEIINESNEDIEYLLSPPVIDMRCDGQNTQIDIAAFATSESSIEKLKALFMIIYQVRCNLEHGQKSPSEERDVGLCLHSSNILTKILKKCI